MKCVCKPNIINNLITETDAKIEVTIGLLTVD